MTSPSLIVRPMTIEDVDAADRAFRRGFGTFLGLPDPMQFGGDGQMVRYRFAAYPELAFVAETEEGVVGTIQGRHWGATVGLGPISVQPEYWGKGVAQRLLDVFLKKAESLEPALTSLYTFSQSPTHVPLYQKYDFWPRLLTSLMTKPIGASVDAPEARRFSETADDTDRADFFAACRALTEGAFAGLVADREIEAVLLQGAGETLLLVDKDGPAAMAVVHVGPGSESGTQAAYVKFAVARSADKVDGLLAACERLGGEKGAKTMTAGVNLACVETYQATRARGFRAFTHGVAMHRFEHEGFDRRDTYVIHDER
ncbi:MAG: GNAT family N-acetyltransferase [Deltaproteobacteria bacterium]|nr:GNAT family N-acetyltransferase [Deltaproteobacteria bacterium]